MTASIDFCHRRCHSCPHQYRDHHIIVLIVALISFTVVLTTPVVSFPLMAPLHRRSLLTSSSPVSTSTDCKLKMSMYTPGRSASRRGSNYDRSKRQYRVGQLVQTELSKIIHSGLIKGKLSGNIESGLRQRISIVSVDISPDLRQARVSVSIRGSTGSPSISTTASDNEVDGGSKISSGGDDVIDKRRAYSWLVENTKSIRHTLAQRLSHMKSSSPSLQFVLVDVSAAVDVMYLIDKVSKGYEREDLDTERMFGADPSYYDYYEDDDADDDEDEDDEWDETDESFFNDDDDDDE